MLHVALCDDDKKFLSLFSIEIKSAFEHQKTPICISIFNNGSDLISSFSRYDPYYDIIFLDINMPCKNGKEVARELRNLDRNFKLIFVTDYSNEVLNAFQFDVIGFLPKPKISIYLDDLVKLIIERINKDHPHMQVFKVKSGHSGNVEEIKLPLNDIMYFESVCREIYLHSQRFTYKLYRYQFTDIVKTYTELGFVDIHRTYIVNINYIFSVEESNIMLDDGTKLPLSRRKKSIIFQKFSEIIGGYDLK